MSLPSLLDDFFRRLVRHDPRRGHRRPDHLGLILTIDLVRLTGGIDSVGFTPGEPPAEQDRHRPERRGGEGTHAPKRVPLKDEILFHSPNKRNENNFCSSKIRSVYNIRDSQ